MIGSGASVRQGGFLVAKIHQLSGRIFSRLLKAYHIEELNPAQGRILFVLWQEDGIPIQQLASRTALGKSTLTHMLDRLEQAGYIRREPDTDDKRQILIFRTEKDRVLQTRYTEVSTAMTRIWYGGMSDRKIDQFERALEHIFNNLRAYDEED